MSTSPQEIRAALRALPTSVVLVAAHVDGIPLGMLASSFSSVSLEPPLVSIAFMRESRSLPRLRRAPVWGISLLSARRTDVLEHLSRPAATRFDGIDLVHCADGAAVLPDAPLTLAVVPEQLVEAGDHYVQMLSVMSIAGDTSHPPLVLHDRVPHQLTVHHI